MADKKKKILSILKRESLSTSKIATHIKSNYLYTLKLLRELEKEKLIKRNPTLKGLYWRLK